MYLYHNIENDLVINVEQIHFRRQIINKLKQRFSTYGYNEIHTSTFENYDLYANMNGTVNHQEMIKTIDNTGKVLVLRPDVTIPITEQIAVNNKEIHEDLRYFYVLDVFRQTTEVEDKRESTQAGVEYFGNASPEADAEIIALAIHLMRDIQVKNFKIELGHAGFFKQLVSEMKLQQADLQELKSYIQAKNITEIEQFLQRLSIDEKISEIVTSLPFLYGNPHEIIERAEKLPLNDHMRETLQNLNEIYQVLHSYGVESHVVIDLSLINHMDYYSDMIFQGFIQKIGKPVLMGGRYDTLASQFNASIPASGFACDIDSLLVGVEQGTLTDLNVIDVAILYEKNVENDALQLANHLRNKQFSVLAYTTTTDVSRIAPSQTIITFTHHKKTFLNDDEELTFTTTDDVVRLLHQVRERN